MFNITTDIYIFTFQIIVFSFLNTTYDIFNKTERMAWKYEKALKLHKKMLGKTKFKKIYKGLDIK